MRISHSNGLVFGNPGVAPTREKSKSDKEKRPNMRSGSACGCFSANLLERHTLSEQMGRKIGYARVSTTHQNTDSQLDDLKADGCEEVFLEKVSSTAPLEQRHQFRACLSVLRKGDQICVARLDRIGRSQV